MDKQVTFSVIMPLYNKVDHVTRSVQSVLNQRFNDFELLIIDDSSSDGSRDKVLEFNDTRIRLFQRDTPGPGGYAARNLGIKEAKGRWIAFLDADDEWFEEHLGQMVDLAECYPDAQFLSCGWKNVWPGGIIQDDAFYSEHANRGKFELSFEEYLEHCIRKMPPTNTYVACLRNNDLAIELFPAGKAKRGGDLHAWAMYLGKCKKLAWSAHIGALYNRDVMDSVTQGSPASTALLRLLVDELSPELSEPERRLLRKYCNRRAWDAWRVNALNASDETFCLAAQLWWSDDVCYCLEKSIVALVPGAVVRVARRIKRASRDLIALVRIVFRPT